jgi:FkbH-like protein
MPTHLVSQMTKLPWLPPTPSDFSEQVKALSTDSNTLGSEFQRLATLQLSRGQANRLGGALRTRMAAGQDIGLPQFRLGIASNATMNMVSDLVPAASLRQRLAVETVLAPFGQVIQEALDPASSLNRADCDAILLAVDYVGLQLDRPHFSNAEAFCHDQIEFLRMIVEGFEQNTNSALILQTLAQPPLSLFGSYDRKTQGSVRSMIDCVNTAIWDLAEEKKAYVLDVSSLAEQVGTFVWFDPVAWHGFKMPFSGEVSPLYAEWLARLLGAIRGRARKCLVLDLDNTCWGGVIGDDGLNGIRLGQGDPIGEAHLAVQRMALDLRERGIILAVASKNDDQVARLPFREHEEMLLKESDIAVFQANWLDKPSNIEAIAEKLNIGIESLVMLDDNPAERAHIQAALPQVAVPELPADPNQFSRYLAAAGYFEAVAFSEDDRNRAQSYASEAQRADVRTKSRDISDYLLSLDMEISFQPFDEKSQPRITQLINKTNQFNVTTCRYTEPQVAAMEQDKSTYTLQVRLRDRFGDMGIIAIVIAKMTPSQMEIDSWLMSCRALGRRVEEAVLKHIVEDALKLDIIEISASYTPTPKNTMVRELFDELGFTLLRKQADGCRQYILSTAEFPALDPPIRVSTTQKLA